MIIELWGGGRWNGQIVGRAEVSPEDFDRLARFRWYLSDQGYAQRSSARPERRTVSMARAVLGLDAGNPLTADHIDRNKLNNTRENLRAIPPTAQAQNRVHRIHSTGASHTSIYRGVSQARSGRWRASCRGKHLGTYDTELKAAWVAAAARGMAMPFSTD
jgi:hypothetical protein